MAKRDDFTVSTKNLLRDRVGNRCSNPHCNRLTSGPANSSGQVVNMGTAAHICAAAKGGPRYNSNMTPEERKSAENGIWLCNFCADLVDKDPERYPVSLLHQWKENAEKHAEYQIHGMRDLHTDNAQYVNYFCETLFLHKNHTNSRVNLRNLFVMPSYLEMPAEEDSVNRTDLYEKIREYIQSGSDMLFISGSGGIGKTTLVAWMNYHYAVNDEIGNGLFGGKNVITIRLRDLDKELISKKHSIIPALIEYLQIKTLDELENRYPDSVMILDGFDELCMIENLPNPTDLIYDLYRKSIRGYKYIITSRPQYIDYTIDVPHQYIVLQHFEISQVQEWIDRYTSDDYCGEKIDEVIIGQILSMDESTFSSICNTPMNLYMLVSKKADNTLICNSWSLFHHIFYSEMSETEYNSMFPSAERYYEHDIILLRDVLYQISEEIAFRMYTSNNSKLFIKEFELKEIVDKISKRIPVLRQASMKDVAAQCYALCCYWKEHGERGAVEFLHNNIRDFFLAEKIYRELDRLIGAEMNGNDDLSYEICNLFKYGPLDTKVTEFLLLRAMSNYEKHVKDFASVGFEKKVFSKLFTRMTSKCEFYTNAFQMENSLAPYEVITNVITCTLQVYRHVLEPYRAEKNDFLNFDGWPTYRCWFKKVFNQVPVTLNSDTALTLASNWDFSSINLEGLDLRNTGFGKSLLCNSNLSNSILSGCDFTDCNLTGADLSDADAHYACFLNAKLDNCDFSGTDLRGTDLPDGFCSPKQDEQVKHLKSLNIHGLKINR